SMTSSSPSMTSSSVSMNSRFTHLDVEFDGDDIDAEKLDVHVDLDDVEIRNVAVETFVDAFKVVAVDSTFSATATTFLDIEPHAAYLASTGVATQTRRAT